MARPRLTFASRRIAWAAVACALAVHAPLAAQATPAGVVIESTAEAIYDEAGMARSVSSNPVQVRVDELLAVAARAGQVALRFLIENTGNGPEQFIIEPDMDAADNGFDAVLAGIAVDSTGNVAYDAGGDQILPAPATSPAIPADAGATIFVLLDIPAGLADGATSQVLLTARAATGSGAPGTLFAGAGEGGGDAVVGSGSASALATGQLVASASTMTFAGTASLASAPTPGPLSPATISAPT